MMPLMAEATDGKEANISGRRFESEVRRELKAHGFTVVRYSAYMENPDKYTYKKLALSNVPYQSIYGHNARGEFLLKIHGRTRNIIIEARRQKVSGSVDEKLPYVYLNALKTAKEKDVFFVYQGEGWKPKAIKWIKTKAKETQGFDVMSLTQFTTWLQNIKVSDAKRD